MSVNNFSLQTVPVTPQITAEKIQAITRGPEKKKKEKMDAKNKQYEQLLNDTGALQTHGSNIEETIAVLNTQYHKFILKSKAQNMIIFLHANSINRKSNEKEGAPSTVKSC